jgi:hypothetical protein
MYKKSSQIDTAGLTRTDKELVNEIVETLKVVDAIAKPSSKASNLDRAIVSNLQSYDNLDGNYRKWIGRKRRFIQKIRDQLQYIHNDIFGQDTYRPETIQCKRQGCPTANKRVGVGTLFCAGCGREF